MAGGGGWLFESCACFAYPLVKNSFKAVFLWWKQRNFSFDICVVWLNLPPFPPFQMIRINMDVQMHGFQRMDSIKVAKLTSRLLSPLQSWVARVICTWSSNVFSYLELVSIQKVISTLYSKIPILFSKLLLKPSMMSVRFSEIMVTK